MGSYRSLASLTNLYEGGPINVKDSRWGGEACQALRGILQSGPNEERRNPD